MSKNVDKTPVKGGWIGRDSRTGQFVEVQGSGGKAKASAASALTVREASSKRRDALKRLADR